MLQSMSALLDVKRDNRETYIVAFDRINEEVDSVLYQYYEMAIKHGVTIENKLDNPTVEQNTYFNNVVAPEFQVSVSFLETKLAKWLSLSHKQSSVLAQAMYSVFMDLRKAGKNDSSLRNTYIKFMCWLYYRFKSVLTKINTINTPKIMYEGNITSYELYMLHVLHRSGCDVVILNNTYQSKILTDTQFPQKWNVDSANAPFNGTYISTLKSRYLLQQKLNALMGPPSAFILKRNAWMNKAEINEVIRTDRTQNGEMICTALLKQTGADDRNTYIHTLYQYYRTAVNANRTVQIVTNTFNPIPQEIAAIKRIRIANETDLLVMCLSNLNVQKNNQGQFIKYQWKDMIDKMNLPLKKKEEQIIKLLAIYNRYKAQMMQNVHNCIFVLQTGAIKDFDYLCCDMLSRMFMDVVIFNPEKIKDTMPESILEFTYEDTVKVAEFPTQETDIVYSTTAYNAVQDYSQMVYEDASVGVYKNRQFREAKAVVLNAMYEELDVVWMSELNVRTGFQTSNKLVTMPVLFAKVCGVKEGNKKEYVKEIEKFVRGNKDVLFFKDIFPFTNSVPAQTNIAMVLTDGHIDKEKLKASVDFRYNYLRDETVDHMIEKLDLLLHAGVIKGMKKSGAENTLLPVFFNLPKQVVNAIQKFDFTKTNPKIFYINTTENILTLEQTVLLQYLSFLGFDILIYVPTGYNVIEKHFEKKLFAEYQVGEYLYNLSLNIRTQKGFFN